MYVRFVLHEIDEDSQTQKGMFVAVNELIDDDYFEDYELEAIGELLSWFNDHLDEPLRLRRSKKYHTVNKAISWFKPGANVHIAKGQQLVTLMKQKDLHVEMIKTTNPGYIVYEDAFQIVAEPFAETFNH